MPVQGKMGLLMVLMLLYFCNITTAITCYSCSGSNTDKSNDCDGDLTSSDKTIGKQSSSVCEGYCVISHYIKDNFIFRACKDIDQLKKGVPPKATAYCYKLKTAAMETCVCNDQDNCNGKPFSYYKERDEGEGKEEATTSKTKTDSGSSDLPSWSLLLTSLIVSIYQIQ